MLITTDKIGPYHNSRYKSLSNENDFNIGVIQYNPQSNTYLWEDCKDKSYKVFNIERYNSKKNLKNQIHKIIDIFNPNVFAIEGWDQLISKYLIFLSNYLKIPSIILSDSRFKDHKRNIYKELIKIILLKGVSSALVAGFESKDYLMKLKFNKDKIFQPYNVVDNEYFANYKINRKYLQNEYILSVGRFINKKNLFRLLNAFEKYKKSGGVLDLMLIGAGPNEKLINNYISHSKYKNSIHKKYWKQISELPFYYKSAKVFVLASTNDQWGLVVNEALASGIVCLVSRECGCFKDLIENGSTGWGFDPYNENELANLFHKSEQIDKYQLSLMKEKIKNKLKNYNLERYVLAVKKASFKSIKEPIYSKISQITSLLLFWFDR